MDDAQVRLTSQEMSALRRIDEELRRQDPRLAASLSDPKVPHTYRWPAVFRMSVKFYLALGILLLVTSILIHHTFSFLVAVTCFVAALIRANLTPRPNHLHR